MRGWPDVGLLAFRVCHRNMLSWCRFWKASALANVVEPIIYLLGMGYGIGLLVRRNPLVMLMCVELMLNGINLSFVAFSRELGDIGGQTVVFFVLVVAAAEVVVGLGLVVAILRRRPAATADDLSALKG